MGNYTIATLNAIRNSASAEYAARIPAATRTNITTIGQALTSYTPLLNEFTTNLIEKIGLTIFAQKMAKNKLAQFKSGNLVTGADVEEIFIEMASAVTYDKTGANPLGRRKPNVSVNYHRKNRLDTYTVSVSDAQVRTAFNSLDGVSKLLDATINSLYSGANYDEYVAMKELLALYEANFYDYQVTAITDATTAGSFVKTVRKAVSDMSYVSTAYNKNGTKQYTDKENMSLLIHKDVIDHVDVDVLAKAFNMGKTDFEPNIIEVDDFGSMTGCYGLLIDNEFFKVFDTLRTMESIRNPEGMFTNYFLHIQQILSVSKFKNAVKFTTDTTLNT